MLWQIKFCILDSVMEKKDQQLAPLCSQRGQNAPINSYNMRFVSGDTTSSVDINRESLSGRVSLDCSLDIKEDKRVMDLLRQSLIYLFAPDKFSCRSQSTVDCTPCQEECKTSASNKYANWTISSEKNVKTKARSSWKPLTLSSCCNWWRYWYFRFIRETPRWFLIPPEEFSGNLNVEFENSAPFCRTHLNSTNVWIKSFCVYCIHLPIAFFCRFQETRDLPCCF